MGYDSSTRVGRGVGDAGLSRAEYTVGAVYDEILGGVGDVGDCDYNREIRLSYCSIRVSSSCRSEQSEVASVLCEVAGPYS